MAYTVAHPPVIEEVMGLILCVIAKDINSLGRGNALAPNQRNSIPCTVPEKGRAIKLLVVCNSWDLEPVDLPNGVAPGCYQPSP